MLFEDGFNHGTFGDRLAGLGRVGTLGFVIVDVEAQNIAILNRMGNGVGVELLLEQIRRGAHRRLCVFDLL